MVCRDVQDSYYDGVVFLLSLATKDEDVVHVDDHDFLHRELSEDVIHHRLDVAGLLVRPKNMTRGLEQAPVHPKKATFPLVSILDLTLLYPHQTISF